MSQPQSATAERRAGAGGRRLAAAFDAVSSCRRWPRRAGALLGLCERQATSPSDLADAVEADAALAIAVMRAANNGNGPPGPRRRRRARRSRRSRSTRVRALAAGRRDLRHPRRARGRAPTATSASAATRSPCASPPSASARSRGCPSATSSRSPRCSTTSASSSWPSSTATTHLGDGRDEAPEERARRERRELGIDHALVGAVLVRRWGLPASIAAGGRAPPRARRRRPRGGDPARAI